MLTTHRLVSSRTARPSSRGGFTLVELLVVIGIIAILAGVALGPITNGIKKAKQSAGLQSAHAIGIAMYSCANDNQQLYPDTANPTGNTGTGAAAAVRPLLSGGYVSDPSIFYISSDTLATKYTGTTSAAPSTITAAEISWDFIGAGGAGMSSVSYPYLPVLWSTLGAAGTITGLAGGPNAAITTTPGSTSLPFGTAGLAIFYANNSSAFITANPAGVVTMVTAPNNAGPATGAVILPGQ
jgi:prepilin-type N-terminal cleavage/methylation domain-containing protein